MSDQRSMRSPQSLERAVIERFPRRLRGSPRSRDSPRPCRVSWAAMGGAEGSPALDRRVVAVMRKMRMDLAIAEVVEALRDAGIPCILLKGPSTARWLFDPGELRTYID